MAASAGDAAAAAADDDAADLELIATAGAECAALVDFDLDDITKADLSEHHTVR